MIIAVPLSWFAISKWLDGFAYRIDIGWIVFLVGFTGGIINSVANGEL